MPPNRRSKTNLPGLLAYLDNASRFGRGRARKSPYERRHQGLSRGARPRHQAISSCSHSAAAGRCMPRPMARCPASSGLIWSPMQRCFPRSGLPWPTQSISNRSRYWRASHLIWSVYRRLCRPRATSGRTVRTRRLVLELDQKRYFLDLRYRGQVHELTVEIPGPEMDRRAWHVRYSRQLRAAISRPSTVAHRRPPTRRSSWSGWASKASRSTPKPSLRSRDQSRSKLHAGRDIAMPVSRWRRASSGFPCMPHRDLRPRQELLGPAFIQNDYLTMIVLARANRSDR